MKKFYSTIFYILTAFLIIGCSSPNQKNQLNSFEKVMVDKVWITTNAVDNNGKSISPVSTDVAAFFGIAQYNRDGTFKILTPEGKLKLSGDWSINDDGTKRKLVAKKLDGSVMFTREVENIAVTNDEYTYRIYPNEKNHSVYFDIIHTPLSVLW